MAGQGDAWLGVVRQGKARHGQHQVKEKRRDGKRMFVVRNSGKGIASRIKVACRAQFVIGFSREEADAFYALLTCDELTDEQEEIADAMLGIFNKIGGKWFIAPRGNT